MKTAAPLPAGTLLANGRYQLQQVLGQGGFAITYLALDTQLKRTVAIKELCPQGCIRDAHNQVAPITLPPDQFAQIRQRFVEEAQLVAQLNHPGIVRIYDVFQQNNTGYMVMEYLHGETLGAKLKRAGGVLPVDEAVDYILQVCDALEVVHRAGYIHRDIKPDNIIHCADGRLVLIDFGAARHFVANQTATYTVMLTPSYAAPEQYSSAGRLDPRTDIYGLAATLYHLITGVPPLPALDRTSGFDLPPPHLVEPKVGEALSRAIQQGLSMRMDERPASVAEFAQLIQSALKEDLQPAPKPSPAKSSSASKSSSSKSSSASKSSSSKSSSASKSSSSKSSSASKSSSSKSSSAPKSSSAQSPPASVPLPAQSPPASVPPPAQSPPASVPPPAQSPPASVPPPAQSPPMPQPSRHASAWESVWEWIQENAWLVSLILLFTLFLIARPFVSELISPTVVELSPEDTQETIIKAFERIRPEGTIRLESGSYYIDKNIVIKKPLKLIGISGSVLVATNHKSLIFRAEGDSQVQNITFQNTAIRVEKGDVTIINCKSLAGNVDYSAIQATSSALVRAENCVVRGYLHGIYAEGNATLKAYNNTCEGNKQVGIALFDSAQGEVSGNACRNNGIHGIVAHEQSRLVAKNNTCEGNKQVGIALFGSAQGEVEGNACRNNGIHGIYADKQSRLVAKNNTCEGNKQVGIALFGSAQGEVEGNACRNNGIHGIYADKQSRLVAKNNTCEGNKQVGIALFGSAQGEVEGNICRNNGYHGIAANEQSRLVAINNRCHNNKIHGIAGYNQSRLVARNNTCEGNKDSGISLFGSAQGDVSGNACRNNGLHGIAASQQSRLVARNNTCEGNKSCGIFLYGRMTGTLENNICGYNLYGIYALRTIRAYVGYNECYNNTQGNLLLNQ
jgi:serine/threonine-protein kinase